MGAGYWQLAMNEPVIDTELAIGEVHCTLQDHAGDVNCVTWSPASRDILCSSCGDKKVRVWKIDKKPSGTLAPLQTITAHKLYVNSCVFNPSGDLLATTSSDGTIKIWSSASWTCLGK